MTAAPAEVARLGETDPGSFRDRQGRVFVRDGRILRGISAHALEEWEALAASGLFRRATGDGRLIATRRVADPPPGAPWAAVLEHERVPFLSYPYEWCFGMLRDAALLQLGLLREALADGLTLKDATPYNVQWIGARPVFIDIASFERYREGEPWAGYRQFCELFLYPLMLQAYRGAPFQPWLRGRLGGIEARELRGLLSWRDLMRPGVLAHVHLQAALASRYDRAGGDVKQEIGRAGFGRDLIEANARRLEKIVGRMRWEPAPTVWSDYAESSPYSPEEREAKRRFVTEVAGLRRRRLVWDLGCNTGELSLLAAEAADLVVAMDTDAACVERLYRSQRGNARILPLLVDVTDASPNLGWRGRERRDLPSRGRPDLVLALALAHHVVIGANVPLDELVDWLAGLGGEIVLELAAKDDPMVRRLLRNKADVYDDYDRAALETRLRRTHEIARVHEIGGGRRVLYHAVPRASA